RTGYSEYWAGMMFLNGEEGFIEKNKQKALHWLNLSCMEGFDTGCEEFEKLTNGKDRPDKTRQASHQALMSDAA
ncbi:hypothetical protein RI672_31925, partial [Pseudomonas aeruginosa]